MLPTRSITKRAERPSIGQEYREDEEEQAMMFTTALAGVLLSGGFLQAEPGDERMPLRGEWLLLSTSDMRRAEAGSPCIRMEISEDGQLSYQLNHLVTNRG